MPPEGIVTVALIEDNRLVREGLAALLGRQDGLFVVAASARADMKSLEQASPAVVLLDIGLHRDDSLVAAKAIRQQFPTMRVVVMDLLPVQDDVVAYVNAGVAGFIMKDATLEDLVKTIRAVAEGTSVLPPAMTSTLFSQIAHEAVSVGQFRVPAGVRMTPRERQVITQIAEGRSNKEIASKLHIATHTVKSHVRNIMEKLTLHTRLQIAAYAHRHEPGHQQTTDEN